MTASPMPAGAAEPSHHSDSTSKLALGALGVVFGDIGTSPLYALKESFAGHHPLPVDQVHIFGVLSLMIWTMLLIVTIKYVFIILRADNQGEGGSLALLALITGTSKDRRWIPAVVMLGIFAAALFYGDAIITPAISVLSAVEGLGAVVTTAGGRGSDSLHGPDPHLGCPNRGLARAEGRGRIRS